MCTKSLTSARHCSAAAPPARLPRKTSSARSHAGASCSPDPEAAAPPGSAALADGVNMRLLQVQHRNVVSFIQEESPPQTNIRFSSGNVFIFMVESPETWTTIFIDFH